MHKVWRPSGKLDRLLRILNGLFEWADQGVPVGEQIKRFPIPRIGALPDFQLLNLFVPFSRHSAVVTRRESGFTTLCELNGISIREAAQRLIEHRTDIADYSERIFSRNDIPFQPLDLESMPHQS